MDELRNLFGESDYPQCEGCSILGQSKPFHCELDHERVNHSSDILFLSDSFTHMFGEAYPFNNKEFALIQEILPHDMKDKTYYSAAVKCPRVKEADMSPSNMNICREHLHQTILTVKPKLVFVCGNLAMKMLIKKSGIMGKRGTPFLFEHEEFECIVVPLYHPYSVLAEPRHRYLFELDIRNSIARVIEKKAKTNFTYEVIDSDDKFESLFHLFTTEDPVACDIETTGFDFIRDSIQTIAFAHSSGNYAIPVDHKSAPEMSKFLIWQTVKGILTNPNNIKVFQNAKFDLKFLWNYQIEAVNVWDTKVMQHLVNENAPKSLLDLVNMYFPEELEEKTKC
jgi:uracil-DNA glycosylase family 4